MSNTYFRFKQFCVHHDRCAMKVGTDGVLLGAWGLTEGFHLLDIGTGTGLIALMMAQRNPSAQIVAIDIDKSAVEQALENVADSPFADRIEVLHQDIQTYLPPLSFDAILCNPPFFTEETLPTDQGRALARNSQLLPFEVLISCTERLLAENGTFSVILPYSTAKEFITQCLKVGLHLIRRCEVKTVEHKPAKRILLTFSRHPEVVHDEALMLMSPDGSRSQAYQALAADFYLW